jgi:hypothetical protein
MSASEKGRLRQALEAACSEGEYGLEDLTVLAAQRDPYRMDTPARHRDGEWLAVQAERLGLGDRTIHLRGLHYMLVSGVVVKPDGNQYRNIDDDWFWLEERAAKAARWLGYVPFEQIIDQRNAPPVIVEFERVELEPFVSVGVDVEIPDADELTPTVGIAGFHGRQPYKLVFLGEKSSLAEVLGPIAEDHEADLYLPTGETSDTLIYDMARRGAEDGRRMVILYFADCDPGGWQMAISVARKLQALRDLEFSDLDFEVRRVALTPDQVREYRLPSTPLKATEKRADKWQEAMGVEQTEIDALAALRPELLEQIARDGVAPFYDYSLRKRVRAAHLEWLDVAQAALDAQIDQEQLARIRENAERKLAELKGEVKAINDALRMGVGDVDLPEAVVPEPELNGQPDRLPLIDSDDSFAEQTRRLKQSKAYEGGE